MCRRRRGAYCSLNRARERGGLLGSVNAILLLVRADPDLPMLAVRCSREIPTCSNCAKRGEECTLGEPQQESEVVLAPPAKKAKRKAGDGAKETPAMISGAWART